MLRRWLTLLNRLGAPGVFGARCDVRRRVTIRRGGCGSVRMGVRCIVDDDFIADASGGGSIVAGDRVIFGHHCTIAAHERVEIGDDCMLAEFVSIRDHDHRFDNPTKPFREQGFAVAPVRVGRNVWIGAKVTVCRGVTIGDNSVIGANSVVTRDVPPGSLAVGAPARVIRSIAATDARQAE